MAVHIDSPVAGVLFDPAEFRIKGWLWLETQQDDIATVEAYDGALLLGSAAAANLTERADVSLKYGLPTGTRTAFDFLAHHPHARPRELFVLELRTRTRAGALGPVIFTRFLAPPPPERHPFQLLCTLVTPSSVGLEIGAHTHPVAGLYPFYTDAVASYAGTAGRVDFLADALALPLADASLDYLCSSHVIEHLPDPLSALHEWHRALRPGGLLYLVAPDKRFTFDEPRPTTTVAHLLRDFETGPPVGGTLAHIEEFVFQNNWSLLRPDTAPADVPREQAAVHARYLDEFARGLPIDIHYHTFTPESLEELLQTAGFLGGPAPRFTALARCERYPPGRDDGIGLLLRKTGTPHPTTVAPSTFLLPSPTPGRADLPLVCPVTLQPLRTITGRGEAPCLAAIPASESAAVASLRPSASNILRYPFVAGRPNLLPPDQAAPRRPWREQGWRATQVLSQSAPPVAMPLTPLQSCLDEPTANTRVDPLCGFIRGWVWLGPQQTAIAAVEAWADATLIGATTTLYERADVTIAHWLTPGTLTGFELFTHHPTAAPDHPLTLEICARLHDGTRTAPIGQVCVHTIARDYRTNHFGVLLSRETTALQRHANIFAVGPSQAEGSGELAHLLRRYLGPPPRRIIDVGCGLGSYGRALLADGYDWVGAEVSAADCAELARLALPHRHVDGHHLPFADAEFSSALCMEVLEHIEHPRAFLAEIRRVAPKQLIVSVPNCELLGYLWDHLATPWHMLEATHTNFFTRWSLAALLREFYPHVELRFHTPYPLRTLEGTPLHYNLLAIASAP